MRAIPFFFCLALFIAGCATQPPDPISEAPPVDLSIAQVRANVADYVGQRVRWGGRITGVENRANETWVDIVALPLESDGRPRFGAESYGRFMARVHGFLDPAVFNSSRAVTAVGTVEGTLTRPIGEYPYVYVIVNTQAYKLWEPIERRAYYYRDPFYDPFYYPWWPGRPWFGPYPFGPYPFWP